MTTCRFEAVCPPEGKGPTAAARRVHNHIMDLFNAQKAEGSFVPVVDDTTLKCRDRLPWWRAEVCVVRRACCPRKLGPPSV